MQTVVETPAYLRAAEKVLSPAEMEDVVSMVAENPWCGDVMPGTGGFRKVRFARAGMGKRGGTRVIYFFWNENHPVFLIAVYAKNAKDNLTKAEQNQLKKLADELTKR
jgi:hypothetical protein